MPEVRARVAHETKIVRIDGPGDTITVRFSVLLEDHSVRLVQVALAPETPDTTMVAVTARRFSFLPGGSRDAQDAALEASLVRLVRRRTTPTGPSGEPGG